MLVLMLIVAVAACLGVGLFLGKMSLVWCALGASLLGLLLLGYLLYADRRSSGAHPDADDDSAVELPGASGADEARDTPRAPEVSTEPSAAAPVWAVAGRPDLASPARIVHVVPGRRRFHVDGCRLLVDKPAEEISLDEAREEGFTACTSCIPDREALPSPR